MRRRNIKTKHILILIIILIIIILAIFSFTLKEDRQLNKFESLIKDTTTGIQKVVSYPFKFIFNKIDDYKELVNIREKYQKLLPEVDRIDSLMTENIELRKQLESMKEELKIDDDTYKSNTAYGVLVQGYGICSGYSDTMAIFLNKLNIDNYKISNDTHIWNLVYINGMWVHLDTTWDDPISDKNLNRDTYFLINSKELEDLKDDTHSFNKNIFSEAN